jgi:O-methyltransferase involved in polyketide biosynthesis
MLHGVTRTLFVPLACRVLENARPDALIHDLRSVELFTQLGDGTDYLRGMSALDQTFTVMRVRQFDHYARAFLESHPGGLVVDIGCGLDTRFDRLDDGKMQWLGLDLPEVIELRSRFIPGGDRCRLLATSMFDLEWLDVVADMNRPVIFLAEGVFPYFSEDQVKPLITALAERFSGGELVFDAFSSFSIWLHNHTHSVLQNMGVQLCWSVDKPLELEAWGLRILEQWTYFDLREPRLGKANLMRYVPLMSKMNTILHYRCASSGK